MFRLSSASAALAIASVIIPIAPTHAVQAKSEARAIYVSAAFGSNEHCPKGTLKQYRAYLSVRQGHFADPGTFTLRLKSGATRVSNGRVMKGSERRDAVYVLNLGRTVSIKRQGFPHSYRFRVDNDRALTSGSADVRCVPR